MDVSTVNAVAGMLLVLLVAGLLGLALYAPRPPRVAQLLFIAAAGFMVLSKGAEPWHAVWLVPLLALALPRWRPALLWQAAIITHFIALMLFQSKVLGNISNQHAIDTPFYLMAAMIGTVSTCILVGLVIRDIFNPAYDVVRRAGVSDPQGGVLLARREADVPGPGVLETGVQHEVASETGAQSEGAAQPSSPKTNDVETA